MRNPICRKRRSLLMSFLPTAHPHAANAMRRPRKLGAVVLCLRGESEQVARGSVSTLPPAVTRLRTKSDTMMRYTAGTERPRSHAPAHEVRPHERMLFVGVVARSRAPVHEVRRAGACQNRSLSAAVPCPPREIRRKLRRSANPERQPILTKTGSPPRSKLNGSRSSMRTLTL